MVLGEVELVHIVRGSVGKDEQALVDIVSSHSIHQALRTTREEKLARDRTGSHSVSLSGATIDYSLREESYYVHEGTGCSTRD